MVDLALLDRVAQRAHDVLLAHDVGEGARAVAAIERGSAHRARSRPSLVSPPGRPPGSGRVASAAVSRARHGPSWRRRGRARRGLPRGWPSAAGSLNYDTLYALVWGRDLAPGALPDLEVAARAHAPPARRRSAALVLTPLGDARRGSTARRRIGACAGARRARRRSTYALGARVVRMAGRRARRGDRPHARARCSSSACAPMSTSPTSRSCSARCSSRRAARARARPCSSCSASPACCAPRRGCSRRLLALPGRGGGAGARAATCAGALARSGSPLAAARPSLGAQRPGRSPATRCTRSRARATRRGDARARSTGLDHVPLTVPRRLGEILREPVLFGAAGGGVLSLVLFLRERARLLARRRRSSRWRLLRARRRRACRSSAATCSCPRRSWRSSAAPAAFGWRRCRTRRPVAAPLVRWRRARPRGPRRLHARARSIASRPARRARSVQARSRTTSHDLARGARRCAPAARRSPCPTTGPSRCWRCGSTCRRGRSSRAQLERPRAGLTSIPPTARVARDFIARPARPRPARSSRRRPASAPAGANASWARRRACRSR